MRVSVLASFRSFQKLVNSHLLWFKINPETEKKSIENKRNSPV
jgi:hypothetical protein